MLAFEVSANQMIIGDTPLYDGIPMVDKPDELPTLVTLEEIMYILVALDGEIDT